MVTHNDTIPQEKELTAKQCRAALLLAEGTNAVQTAKKVGISRPTIERWKRQAAFQAEVRRVEDEIYRESLSLLKRTLKAAIVTQIALLDPKNSGYVRQAAASHLIDKALEVGISLETEDRLHELETLLAHSDIQPRGSDD